MSVETIARRYAVALADVVIKSGDADTVRTELNAWVDLIESNPDLERALESPAIAHSNKQGVLEGLIAKTKPTKTTANFLRVLLRNSRIAQLPQISERFHHELEDRSGESHASVTSARALSEAEKSEFQKTIEKLTGRTVNINYAVDESIIGGVVTRVGSTVYDGSVKTQLENLKEKLVNG